LLRPDRRLLRLLAGRAWFHHGLLGD